MPSYSVADAKNNLSDLIDRALRGEGVVITRHGTPVITFEAIHAPTKPVTAADVAWSAAQRIEPIRSPAINAADLVSTMRDEDGH